MWPTGQALDIVPLKENSAGFIHPVHRTENYRSPTRILTPTVRPADNGISITEYLNFVQRLISRTEHVFFSEYQAMGKVQEYSNDTL
jgi:hypothetical protein